MKRCLKVFLGKVLVSKYCKTNVQGQTWSKIKQINRKRANWSLWTTSEKFHLILHLFFLIVSRPG